MASDIDIPRPLASSQSGDKVTDIDTTAPASNTISASDRDVSTSTGAEKQQRSKGGREIEDLLRLPIVREMPWKEGKALDLARSLESPRPQKKGASMLAVRGEVRDPPCSHCAGDYGRFSRCIALSDWFNGACATCQFGSRGNLCTFRDPDTLQNRARKEVKPEKNAKRSLHSIPKYQAPGDTEADDTEQEEDEKEMKASGKDLSDASTTPNPATNGHKKRKRRSDPTDSDKLVSPRDSLEPGEPIATPTTWRPYESPYRSLELPKGAANPLNRHSLPSTPKLHSPTNGSHPSGSTNGQPAFRIEGYTQLDGQLNYFDRQRGRPHRDPPDDGPRQYQRIAPQQTPQQLPRLAPISIHGQPSNIPSRSPLLHSGHSSNGYPDSTYSQSPHPSSSHPNSAHHAHQTSTNSATNSGHPLSAHPSNGYPRIVYPNFATPTVPPREDMPSSDHSSEPPRQSTQGTTGHTNTNHAARLSSDHPNVYVNGSHPTSQSHPHHNGHTNSLPANNLSSEAILYDQSHKGHPSHPPILTTQHLALPPMKTGFTPVKSMPVDRDATESLSPVEQRVQLPSSYYPAPTITQSIQGIVAPLSRPPPAPENTIIDSLPRKKQKQIFSIIGGLQSGIRSCFQQAENMQKQLDLLQEAFGIEPDEEVAR